MATKKGCKECLYYDFHAIFCESFCKHKQYCFEGELFEPKEEV